VDGGPKADQDDGTGWQRRRVVLSATWYYMSDSLGLIAECALVHPVHVKALPLGSAFRLEFCGDRRHDFAARSTGN